MMATGKSVDGFEIHFGVNHLGHFLLTNLLLDLMKKAPSARIINVASINHARKLLCFSVHECSFCLFLVPTCTINWDDINFEKPHWRMYAYSHSKLANVLFTYELARKLSGFYSICFIALKFHFYLFQEQMLLLIVFILVTYF